MVAIKVYEYEAKTRTFVTALLSRFDQPFGEKFSAGLKVLDTSRDRVLSIVTQEFPKQTKYFFLLIRKQIQEKYSLMILDTRGSRVLKQDGEVSSFLKDIARDKKENGGGSITEESIN